MNIVRNLAVSSIVIAFVSTFALADVLNGKKLFQDPSFANSSNSKSCNTCHPDGRGLENAAGKEQYSIMNKDLASIESTVNTCIVKALKGDKIEKDSKEMKDIVEYIRSLKGKEFKKKRVIKGC